MTPGSHRQPHSVDGLGLVHICYLFPHSHPDRTQSFLLYIHYYFVLLVDNIPSTLGLVREHESYSHKQKSMDFTEDLLQILVYLGRAVGPPVTSTLVAAQMAKLQWKTQAGKLQPWVTGPSAPHPWEGPARPLEDIKC